MMKRKGWIIGLGLIVALGGTSAAVAAEGVTSYIGKIKAKQIALNAAPGTVTDIELDRERNTVYYEVDIDRKDTFQDVDVHVDAATGKVLKVKNDDDDTPRTTTAPTTAPTTSPTSAPSAESASTTITKEQAGKLAQQKVKGEVIRVETDWDDGMKKFEVKLRTAAGRAEVDIAAATGKVLDVDYDNDDDDNDDDNDNDDDDDYDYDSDDDKHDDDDRD
ncbi:PepSY domain-containing protein [Paenibacillus sp. YIM B09110]|uniref:PepSY domain-containing protein n=1 Tax=Paenibacillus sp. YIM B09110 TaxID=3126102 RepID=UPI00301D1528